MFVKPLLGLAFLYISSCTSLLYYPSKLVFDNPKRHKLDVENHVIVTKDQLRLHAWLLSSSTAKIKKGLILQFHGNAENLSTHYLSLAWLAHLGYDVLIFDYRGYGLSEGTPSIRGLYLDSQAVYKYALQLRTEKKYSQFIIVAQSLGGSVALRTLSENTITNSQVNLVIFDSTFRSNSEVSATILRKSWPTFLFSPLAYIFMQDNYNAQEKDLQNWPYKTICITHPDDPVVPSILTVKLYHSLKASKYKWLWLRDDIYGGHASAFFTPDGPLNQKLINFLAKEI